MLWQVETRSRLGKLSAASNLFSRCGLLTFRILRILGGPLLAPYQAPLCHTKPLLGGVGSGKGIFFPSLVKCKSKWKERMAGGVKAEVLSIPKSKELWVMGCCVTSAEEG